GRSGDLREAERLFARALEIQRQDPQARGPELAGTLIDDAALALAAGDPPRALSLSLEAEAIAREHFLRTSRGLHEADALRYETVRKSGLDVAISALAAVPGGRGAIASGAAARVWDE